MIPLFKILYVGPLGSGKTTNLKYIYSHLAPGDKSEFQVNLTENGEVVSFEFRITYPLVSFLLLTVKGEHNFKRTRALLSERVDGLVFVADSDIERMEDNLIVLNELSDLGELNKDRPFVFQYNKRDLSNIAPVDKMEIALNEDQRLSIEAVASEGLGVFKTQMSISKLITDKYCKGQHSGRS
ncbi:gliding-motility protein MglA [bacterium]|nr:gliding-motility protein MglA [bacterium]MBP9807877.1 gliding-motility protein MglA [bacterium]